MVNPVELIASARRRLAIVAATSVAIYALMPGIVALILAGVLESINASARTRLGYELGAAALNGLQIGLVAAGVTDLTLCAALAWRAWRRADDFVAAAARVDSIVDAHEEVLTLATLADPAHPETRANRTALFPILWRRAAAYLAHFAPDRAFRLELGTPLKRGSALALAVVILFGLTMMALVRPPSPEIAQARQLRQMANRIAESSPGPEGRALAKALLDTAAALENPKLPPEQKIEKLTEAMNELERLQPPPESARAQRQSGKGNGGGKGSSAKGEGSGTGEGKGSGKGTSPGAGTGGKGEKKQIAQIEKALSQAKERIESESAPKDKSMPKPSLGGKGGSALAKGEKPNQPGPEINPNASAEKNLPKPGENPPRNADGGEGGKQEAKTNKGSTKGDTRLGEFPAPVHYERFYKPGEKGPPIDIRNARYLVFRLPEATVSSGGGKVVMDTERPMASTPYSNVPLKAERLPATPDERQPVPPRYRDLIQ